MYQDDWVVDEIENLIKRKSSLLWLNCSMTTEN